MASRQGGRFTSERLDDLRRNEWTESSGTGGRFSPEWVVGISGIPNWSAEQALAVWEFLEELTSRVWDRYDVQLVELIRPDLDPEDDTQPDLFDPDDPIPF